MVVKFLVFHLKQIPSLSQEFFYWLNVAHVAARLVSVLWNHLGNLNTYHQYSYSPNSSIPFSFAISKDREVIMQSRPALYCCVRWLRTSEAELDNAHWTHGLTVAWPYMYFSFSVWKPQPSRSPCHADVAQHDQNSWLLPGWVTFVLKVTHFLWKVQSL